MNDIHKKSQTFLRFSNLVSLNQNEKKTGAFSIPSILVL